MLGTDVVVAQPKGLAKGQFHHLLRPRCKGRRASWSRPRDADRLFDPRADVLECHPQLSQCLGRDAVTLIQEAEQDVLGADEGVVEKARLFLGQDEDTACAVGESFERESSLTR
jgi:hypothetical protein